MISPFFGTMSRSSAMSTGLIAAFVWTMWASPADAAAAVLDRLGRAVSPVEQPIARHQSANDVMLAQYVDDCTCDDVEEHDDDYAEDDEEEFGGEFDEDFADDFDEDYAEDDDGDAVAENQGLSDQERLDDVTNRQLDRQVQMIEKQILWRNPLFSQF